MWRTGVLTDGSSWGDLFGWGAFHEKSSLTGWNRMEHAVQMEIFRNNGTTFVGTPLFPLQPIPVPTGWKENYRYMGKHFPFLLLANYTNFLGHHDLPMKLQVFQPHWKTHSCWHWKFPEFQPKKKLAKWKAPLVFNSEIPRPKLKTDRFSYHS